MSLIACLIEHSDDSSTECCSGIRVADKHSNLSRTRCVYGDVPQDRDSQRHTCQTGIKLEILSYCRQLESTVGQALQRVRHEGKFTLSPVAGAAAVVADP